jgi:hypothetical protein
MSRRAVQHPGLAEISRGALTEEVIQTFQALAKLVVEVWKIRKMEVDALPDVESIRCLFEEAETDFRAFQFQRSWTQADSTSIEDPEASIDHDSSGNGSISVSESHPHLLFRLDLTIFFTFLYDNPTSSVNTSNVFGSSLKFNKLMRRTIVCSNSFRGCSLCYKR